MVSKYLYLAFVVLSVIAVSQGAVSAQETTAELPKARIDISAEDGAFELMNIKATGDTDVIIETLTGETSNVTFAIVKEDAVASWRKLTITFMPVKSGRVKITLGGAHFENMEEDHRSIVFDDLSIAKNDVISNGGFEESDPDGKPVGWDGTPEVYISNKKEARTGSGAIQVWHDQRLEQTIEVKGWNEYTINAYFKAAK
ncbi:MAG: hypothetical protein JW844_01720 [Candidatus Omnitrophica bacterium]|nr:hypothetical protein [Candidatus Omnitrophota bacterium]